MARPRLKTSHRGEAPGRRQSGPDFLEEKAGFARVGTDGQERVKCPLLFALFDHGTSRAEDPQLHTHALLINLTRHGDGRTTAIDPTYIYHWKMAAGADLPGSSCGQGMLELGFAAQGTANRLEHRLASSPASRKAWIDDSASGGRKSRRSSPSQGEPGRR